MVRVVRGGAIVLDGTSIALGADIKAELIYPPFTRALIPCAISYTAIA